MARPLILAVALLIAGPAFAQAAPPPSPSAEAQVIVATMQTIDGFDLKKEAWTAYRKAPGPACPAVK